ncbi:MULTISPECIES: HAAS signaling domain-containing protein [unclassified Ornithinimicrobium]|uniref:HAAS signaling domain-containing protein n=1 Tax=unclassified Ornithinimicrobium TaxID=2615080 RepID=UPI003853C9B1
MTTPTTTLTDRYVDAVTRRLPEASRDDVGRELRATILDTVESRPDLDREVAEREALVALGDPERLAASYSGHGLYLIGPSVFLLWRRVLLVLLSIVPAVVAGVTIVVAILEGAEDVIQVLAEALGSAWEAALQVGLWTTLGFAIAERNDAAREGLEDGLSRGRGWTPDDLPEPSAPRVSRGDAIGGLVVASVLAALVGLGPNPLARVDGEPVPLFTDEAYSGRWMLVVVLLVWAAIELGKLVRGRWTWSLAVVNVVQNVAFVALVAWWLLRDGLFNDTIVERVWVGEPQTWRVLLLVLMGGIALWDSVDSVWKAHRQAR